MIACLLAGCSTVPLERRAIQAEQLLAGTTYSPPSCGYRLGSVGDRRVGTTAGSLGGNAFSLDDASALVRRRLLEGGLFSGGHGLPVSVDVLQLYIAANQSTKIPVVVYRVRIQDDAPVVLRSRAASMNWNSSEAETRKGITRALEDVEAQLSRTLDTRCRSAPTAFGSHH